MLYRNAIAAAFPILAGAACRADNARLLTLVNEDQADRQHIGHHTDQARVAEIIAHDAARRNEVRAMLAAAQLVSAAAFQHGADAEDYRIAFSMATLAVEIDPGRVGARHLIGMSWDRLLLKLGKPQWYGTQSHWNEDSQQWELEKMDENAVTDEERYRLALPSAVLAREHVRQMN
jgi:hypothetical protein